MGTAANLEDDELEDDAPHTQLNLPRYHEN
jgi:hypothetical protein